MLAVDMSNYTDPLTAAAVQQLKDAGVGHVIVQAIDPPPGYPVGRTRAQIQACLDAGLTVDAYVWLWFDLDASDVERKLALLSGLNVHQLWLDVEDTAAIKYDQPTTESKVAAALAVCDAFATASGEKAGVYSGRWFWLDRRYMGNTTSFADRQLWDANYDDVADAALGFAPYGGWQQCVIKQFRGSTKLAGVGGLDVNVLSVDKLSELTAPVAQPTLPAGRGAVRAQSDPSADSGSTDSSGQPDQPTDRSTTDTSPGDTSTTDTSTTDTGRRETPDDWLWPSWREAAIQFQAIANELGAQLAAAEATPTAGMRETPDDWQWPTWREAAIQYRSIADQLGQQIAAAVVPAPTPPPARETPSDWQWPTWYEAAVQYKAIADQLGVELAAAKNPPPPTSS